VVKYNNNKKGVMDVQSDESKEKQVMGKEIGE